ncbi:MAG: hypothetical protein QOJ52_407, partial [Acidimicrobiaceae bacterium]|nr:hypothetical protein [Acidimicrobiaceae bacterium]
RRGAWPLGPRSAHLHQRRVSRLGRCQVAKPSLPRRWWRRRSVPRRILEGLPEDRGWLPLGPIRIGRVAGRATRRQPEGPHRGRRRPGGPRRRLEAEPLALPHQWCRDVATTDLCGRAEPARGWEAGPGRRAFARVAEGRGGPGWLKIAVVNRGWHCDRQQPVSERAAFGVDAGPGRCAAAAVAPRREAGPCRRVMAGPSGPGGEPGCRVMAGTA